MTSSHFLFIPAVLIVGIFIGFMLGTRAAADRLNLERKREQEREEARKNRAERKAKRKAEQADETAKESA